MVKIIGNFTDFNGQAGKLTVSYNNQWGFLKAKLNGKSLKVHEHGKGCGELFHGNIGYSVNSGDAILDSNYADIKLIRLASIMEGCYGVYIGGKCIHESSAGFPSDYETALEKSTPGYCCEVILAIIFLIVIFILTIATWGLFGLLLLVFMVFVFGYYGQKNRAEHEYNIDAYLKNGSNV